MNASNLYTETHIKMSSLHPVLRQRQSHLFKQFMAYPEISHMINPPELKCPQFPFLHQPIAVRTTTATTADVKKTRHRS